MTVRSWTNPLALLIALLFVGCSSPLVGLECKAGYTRCENACFDLRRDEENCGACGATCISGQTCIAGLCTWDDGSDAGAGGQDQGSGLHPLCKGKGSAPDCVCSVGQLRCGYDCVDALVDPKNCGYCGGDCGTGFCSAGACVPDCGDLALCGRSCVDLKTSINYCGTCNSYCESGVCVDGHCEAGVAGHVVLLGFDLRGAAPRTLEQLIGNAVSFLPIEKPTVTVYKDDSDPGAVDTLNNYITEWAQRAGRDIKLLKATSLTVPFLLGRSQVFVIAPQHRATDFALKKNGDAWGPALRAFLRGGGVIVAFDGGNNHGTYQILEAAGVIEVNERVDVTSKTLDVINRTDLVSAYIPARFATPQRSYAYDTGESGAVVRDPDSELPVVLHIVR